jgi:hypothetical protein
MVMAQNLHTQTKRKRDCEHQFTEANRPRMFLDVRFGLSVMVVSPGASPHPSPRAGRSPVLSALLGGERELRNWFAAPRPSPRQERDASRRSTVTLSRLPSAAIFLPGARILYLPLARR